MIMTPVTICILYYDVLKRSYILVLGKWLVDGHNRTMLMTRALPFLFIYD